MWFHDNRRFIVYYRDRMDASYFDNYFKFYKE